MQLVHFVERGERSKMSKRRGDFVALDELLDDIGVDAARWFMLERSHDTPLDLDLDLARERSQDNPVYYVQYAHARIAAILRKAGDGACRARSRRGPGRRPREAGAGRARAWSSGCWSCRRRWSRPASAARRTGSRSMRTTWRRTSTPSTATAASWAPSPPELEDFRLVLCDATRHVIARVLDLAGVEAPESM